MKKFSSITALLLLSLTGFTQQHVTLNQQEKDAISYLREEEKLARDVYDSMYAKWQVNPFGNIRHSEQNHMDRMQTLIRSYNLTDPILSTNDKKGAFTNTTLQSLYNELVTTGSRSLNAALKVGAKIEELDINDLEERVKQTKQLHIITTYNALKMASENHLRAFVRRLKVLGENYEPIMLNKLQFEKIIAADN
jgi:hypothetical protein